MRTKTPISIARAQRDIAAHLDLARRQQRITVELLAERAGVSVPTVRRLLREGTGSLETYLRVSRILGLLEGAVAASDPLNTPIGRIRADEETPLRVRN